MLCDRFCEQFLGVLKRERLCAVYSLLHTGDHLKFDGAGIFDDYPFWLRHITMVPVWKIGKRFVDCYCVLIHETFFLSSTMCTFLVFCVILFCCLCLWYLYVIYYDCNTSFFTRGECNMHKFVLIYIHFPFFNHCWKFGQLLNQNWHSGISINVLSYFSNNFPNNLDVVLNNYIGLYNVTCCGDLSVFFQQKETNFEHISVENSSNEYVNVTTAFHVSSLNRVEDIWSILGAFRIQCCRHLGKCTEMERARIKCTHIFLTQEE